MALTVDKFTKRCVKRATESVTTTTTASNDGSGAVGETKVGIAWMALLAPVIEAAMLMLMDRMGQCGDSTEQKLKKINDGSPSAKYQVHLAVNQAIAERGIRWRDAIPLRKVSRDSICEEAKETPDNDLAPVFDEVDGYHFDAADAWGFTGE